MNFKPQIQRSLPDYKKLAKEFYTKEVMKEELHQEEINHPEETVHGRAFIKNFDD